MSTQALIERYFTVRSNHILRYEPVTFKSSGSCSPWFITVAQTSATSHWFQYFWLFATFANEVARSAVSFFWTMEYWQLKFGPIDELILLRISTWLPLGCNKWQQLRPFKIPSSTQQRNVFSSSCRTGINCTSTSSPAKSLEISHVTSALVRKAHFYGVLRYYLARTTSAVPVIVYQ